MPAQFNRLAVSALLSGTASVLAAAASGSGTTTRYWDCCKPSCAWNDLSTLGITSAVTSCDASDKPLSDSSVQSACAGGTAYMCSNQSPWAVSSTEAYGFAAVSAATPKCCQCYKLTFTSGPISGNTMIVQATNTGSDVSSTQFDLAMPGGGFGIFDACTKEWDATSAVWGAQYGGPSTNTCPSFPAALQPGCDFRWDWMQGADNPTVDWEEVSCPAAITAKSGCVRTGDSPSGPSSVGGASSAPATSAAPAPSSTSPAAAPPAPMSTSSSISEAAPAPSTYSSSSSVAAAPVPVSTSSAVALPESSSTIAPSPTIVEAPEPTETDDDTCEL